MRLSRSRLLATAVLAVATGTAALAAPSAGGAAPAPSPTAVRYAVQRPLCATPASPQQMRCYAVKRVDVPRGTAGAFAYRPAALRGPAGGYTPQALASAYRYTPTTKRSNLTVGIVLWHDAPDVKADLNHFDRHYGFRTETATSFRKVNQRGTASPLPKRDRGASGEIALDTQTVRAVCRTCRILLVEADSAGDRDLAAAVNTAVRLGADVVTNSYGRPEFGLSTALKNAFHHPGVAMVASTGDDGWFGWDYLNEGYASDGAASFPASSPYVVAVGGTTLQVDASGRRTSETVWNSNGPGDARGAARAAALGASGGGCSRAQTAMPWQYHATGYAALGCGGRRSATDVAAVADPATGFDVYDSYGSGGWVTVGGTSLSSPLVAGMIALAGGTRGARFASSAIYGNRAAHPGRVADVTVGGNSFCGGRSPAACSLASTALLGASNPNRVGAGVVDCSFARRSTGTVPAAANAECNATTGLDGPTGVGAPVGTGLFTRTDPYLTLAAGTPRHGRTSTYRATVREVLPATRVTRYTWRWGDGSKPTVTTTASARHKYAKAGRRTITLTVNDSRYQTSVLTKKVTVR